MAKAASEDDEAATDRAAFEAGARFPAAFLQRTSKIGSQALERRSQAEQDSDQDRQAQGKEEHLQSQLDLTQAGQVGRAG